MKPDELELQSQRWVQAESKRVVQMELRAAECRLNMEPVHTCTQAERSTSFTLSCLFVFFCLNCIMITMTKCKSNKNCVYFKCLFVKTQVIRLCDTQEVAKYIYLTHTFLWARFSSWRTTHFLLACLYYNVLH